MTDKELLELAAKAAGYPISEGYFDSNERGGDYWVYIDGNGEPPNDSAWTELWNPLTCDGDALRLAVKLKLSLHTFDLYSLVETGFDDGGFREASDDPYAATRRAIVRAAAEIGKNMSWTTKE